MKTIFCAVILFAAFVKADKDNDNWPCYMKKCEKSSANLESCLVAHANRALDGVMQGDPTIGIPQYNAYYLGSAFFGQNDTYKSYLENSKIYGLKHLRVTGFQWNFHKKTVNINFLYNSAITLSADYNSSGTFLGRDIRGEGQIDLVFVGESGGANLTYSMNYELLKVLGRDYVQIKDKTCTSTAQLRINFNNKLRSQSQVESSIKYLHNHAAEVNKTPVLQNIVCSLVSQALHAVFYNFPLDLVFDK